MNKPKALSSYYFIDEHGKALYFAQYELVCYVLEQLFEKACMDAVENLHGMTNGPHYVSVPRLRQLLDYALEQFKKGVDPCPGHQLVCTCQLCAEDQAKLPKRTINGGRYTRKRDRG